MSFKVRIANSVRRRIAEWSLPDSILVDVYLQLQDLQDAPQQKLVRLEAPFSGLVFGFSLIDPADRMTEYRFFFQVQYGQDEETIHVVKGGFQRTSL